MALHAGVRLGPYEIISAIGAGGMGEVYRAHDSRLVRDVAIKVLPAAFSADPERLQRFEQEARAAAALNHANILALYDIGQHEGSPYIVLELLEGDTLRERLNAGALTVRKAVEYAFQIAHGLAAAHEKGIVHRDLKPENVFVATDGRVKILDFGLAKLTQAEPALAGLSALPTTPPNTTPGVVLGSMGYMSPEQVRGLQADHRSDIFAFGAVLYEMLAGQRAFRGETTADTMSAILKEDPPALPALERRIPPALLRIAHRCLEKGPASRFKSADDLAFALEGLSSEPGSTLVIGGATRWKKLRGRLGWSLAATSTLALFAVLFVPRPREVTVSDGVIRFTVAPPDDAAFTGGVAYAPAQAVSPDGRQMVFRARRTGDIDLLWIRAFDAIEARPVSGTEGGDFPFWSPDNRFVGFFADGKLKKIEVSGGPPQILCDAPNGQGGTWNRDGLIVFATSSNTGLSRVSAAGGETVAVTAMDVSQKDTSHAFPQFLPDRRRFVFLARPSNSVRVGSIDASEVKTLLTADSKAQYVAPGYLVFVREQTLMAQPFDASQAALTGDAFPIAETVRVNPSTGRAAFSVSDSGVLAYRPGAAFPDKSQLTWFDRAGKVLQTIGRPEDYLNVALSPDDARLIVHRHEERSGGGLWLFDWRRGTTARFTSGPSHDVSPKWSPDGGSIVFASDRDGGVLNLYQKALGGTGGDERLLNSDNQQVPNSWSTDGRFIVYHEADPKTRTTDLWVLPLFGDRKPIPFLRTEFTEAWGALSPNGRWMAYTSDETGTKAIYVQPFPPSGLKYPVSPDGGVYSRWSRDGKELFYLAGDATGISVMATDVRTDSATFEAGVPRVLFRTQSDARFVGQFGGNLVNDPYAVSSDGQRFIDLLPTGQAVEEPITVVLNWTALLER